jgi:predicted small lipoprotein YifL
MRLEGFRAPVVTACLLATIACGKKGPPLLPYVRQPAAAEITAVRRVGNEVFVTVSVPTVNVDQSRPASLAEIKVYAVTAQTPPPPGLSFLNGAALVTTIPVAQEADPSDRSGTVVADPKTGALQGTSVTIREGLSAEAFIARPPVPLGAGKAPPVPEITAAAGRAQPLRRFYLTVPFSARQQSGPPSRVMDVPLSFVPDRIPALRASMDGHSIRLEWEPSGGLVGWFLDRPLAPEVPLTEQAGTTTPVAPSGSPGATPPTSGPTLYNIYREIAPDPLARTEGEVTPSPWTSRPVTPINPQPLAALTFSDDVPFDDRRRCYQVRAVRGSGTQQVESEPSQRECIVPVDVEPPAAPTGLRSTFVEDGVMLLWEPNGEEDFRGYIILRREAGDDTLLQLTNVPIVATQHIDAGTVSGRMYVYVVQAVDNRIPAPNVSEPTEITVTAR